jgi:hypothetical protein
MNRDLDPILRVLLEGLEADLDPLGFRLDAEAYHHAAFGSANLEYSRRGARLQFTWDGKDRWAWMNLAAQTTAAFPRPDAYGNLDAGHTVPGQFAPRLSTREQASRRAAELIARLKDALATMPEPRSDGH